VPGMHEVSLGSSVVGLHGVSTAAPPSLRWLRALREPALTQHWTLADWERVVRLSRRLRLLARLAQSVKAADLLDTVPPAVRRHLIAEMRLSEARTVAVTWALERVTSHLGDVPYPLVLLKGIAYLGQELTIARGRLPSDLDVLVPRAHIADAQARLMAAGWAEAEMDEHDRRYYHEWSHEVPPMRHPVHPMELDLHHNILPPLARTHVDADALLARLRPSRWRGWQVLHPIDQVLHSSAHLFLDPEPVDRLRDIVDIDGLLRHFGSTPGFWDELPGRAQALGLSEPLALAVHFTTSWLDTPVPPAVRRDVARRGPGTARRSWLEPLMARVLMPAEPDAPPSRSQALAAQIVLARYHYHRLPLRLLVPHLWRKWNARRADAEVGPPADLA